MIMKLCLDVGSGSNPRIIEGCKFVYCDKYILPTHHRGFSQIQIPENSDFIICDAHYLPFKNDVFDRVFCSHLLEHLENPKQAINEIKRVGKTYEIRVPHPTWEYLMATFGMQDNGHKWFFYSLDCFEPEIVIPLKNPQLSIQLKGWKKIFEFIRTKRFLAKIFVRLFISPFVYLYCPELVFKSKLNSACGESFLSRKDCK